MNIKAESVRSLKNVTKKDVAFAGGKGAFLGDMTAAGIPVPPGFVVSAQAFEEFLNQANINVELVSILDNTDHKTVNTVSDISEKAKGLIANAGIPEALEKEIKETFEGLNAKYVAVRSSATSEDSVDASWAGQLESYLNTTEENLLENIKKCWASLFTPKAISYRLEKGLHRKPVSVAVVVQKMVESEVSGVAFSVHPVTQDPDQMIIEAGFGLGEAIVAGSITPDSYVVKKSTKDLVEKRINTQERGLFRNEEGVNEWLNVPKVLGEQAGLSDEEAIELSGIVQNIEKNYGFPVDVEWAKERGRFYILQSRAITTI